MTDTPTTTRSAVGGFLPSTSATPTTTRSAVGESAPNTSATPVVTRSAVGGAAPNTSATPSSTRAAVVQVEPTFLFRGDKLRPKQIDVSVPLPMWVTTVAGLPSAVGLHAHIAFVTDEVGGAVHVFSDGVVWRRWTDRAEATT